MKAVDAGRLRAATEAALVGGRSTAELYDGVVTTLRDLLGARALVSIYVVEEDRLWLEAQSGYPAVVHTLALDTGVFGRALREDRAQVVADVADDPDYRPVVDGVRAAVALPFPTGSGRAVLGVELLSTPLPDGLLAGLVGALGAVSEAVSALSPRARAATPMTRLSRMFVRLSSQRDAGRLLELASRSVGDILGLDCVQAAVGDRSPLVQEAVWRRSLRSTTGLSLDRIEALGEAVSWEPTHSQLEEAVGPLTADLAASRLGSIVLLPLCSGGEMLGILCGTAGPDVEPFPADRFEQAELLAAHAGTALGGLRRYETVVTASLTDALTGLPNHRGFHEAGAGLLEASRSGGPGFAVVVADLDDFKDLNDRRGHVAGDDALRLVGALFSRGIRPDDRAYRMGGEEFALLLPSTTKSNARTVCRRLQRALALVDLDGWRLTQSMGVAAFPEDGDTLRDLLAAADAALYEAKRLGKDRITLAHEQLSARRTQGETMAARGRRSFEQMRHLQALTSTLAGVASPRGVGEAILGELASALPHDVSATYLLDPLERIAGRGSDSPAVAGLLTVYAHQACDGGRSFLVDDAAQDRTPAAGETGVVRGIVASPLFAEERIVGAIVVGAKVASRFDRDDQRLLEVMAHIGGLACENLRLLVKSSAAAEAAETALALGERLVDCRSLDEVARVGVAAARELVRADGALLTWLVDDEADDDATLRRADVVRLRTSSSLVLPSGEGETALLPLRAGSTLVAVLELQRRRSFDGAERTTLERLAAQIGLAITARRLVELTEAGGGG